MNLQNKKQGRFCRTDRQTDGHFLDLAQLKLRIKKILIKKCVHLNHYLYFRSRVWAIQAIIYMPLAHLVLFKPLSVLTQSIWGYSIHYLYVHSLSGAWMVDLSNSEWKSVVYVNTAYQDNLYLGSKSEQRSKSRSMLNLEMVDKFPSVTIPSVTIDNPHKLK